MNNPFPNNFTEKDYEKVVEFLNFIGNRAIFGDWKTEDTIKHFGLLGHMQTTILPKIKANIAEIKKVIEPDDVKTETSKRKRKVTK